jgi:hypothetical protein
MRLGSATIADIRTAAASGRRPRSQSRDSMPKLDGRGRHRATSESRVRVRRGLVVAVALTAVAVSVGACGGGGSSPGVASLGSTVTTTTTPTAAGNSGGLPNKQQAYEDLLSYAQCMRSHGIADFPDPTQSAHGVGIGQPANTKSPQYKAADTACKHFLPNGGGPPSAAQIAAVTARLLKYAQCVRKHGVPNFPDPSVQSNGQGLEIRIGGPGLDKNAPQLQAAQKACQSLLPGGGP